MSQVTGRVLVRETGQGIPNLVVALFDADPVGSPPGTGTPPSGGPDGDVNFGERLGSILTGGDGKFELQYDSHLFAAGDPEKRADLVLAVFAPEDSQGPNQPRTLPPSQRLLLYSNVARQNAGEVEAYALRIARAQLDRFGIPYGDGSSSPAMLTESILRAWESRDAMRERLAPRMREETAKATQTRKHAKDLFEHLSAVPAAMRESRLFVHRGAAPGAAQDEAIEQGMRQVRLYQGGMRLRLTEAQLAELGLEVQNGRVTGDVDAAAVLQAASRRVPQELLRVRSLVDGCRDEELRQTAFTPPGHGPGDDLQPPAPLVDGSPAEEQVLSRILAQIRDLEADTAKLDVRPDAGRIQSEVDMLQLKGGPADAPGLHDFNVLQIAFKHVWTEAFDESLRATAEALYGEAVRLAGEQGNDAPVLDAIRDANGLRDFVEQMRGYQEHAARLVPVPTELLPWIPQLTPAIWNTLDSDQKEAIRWLALAISIDGGHPDLLAKHRVDVETILAHPASTLSRLDRLILDIGQQLAEPYAFHVFAPGSYNFGILTTYRQRWEPLAYQVGDLVATVPLAPGETRKFTQRTTIRKNRSERELEKSLSSRREEATQTSRADLEIVQKASTATNFKAAAAGAFNIGIAKLSATTDFALNQEHASEMVKKDFREAVIRAAQDYSQERTLEVTTSHSEDVETSTSGELANPNNELTVTYLLYELQRRYSISEHLHRLTPVILVAQDVPAPHEINEAWLLANEWILRRVLLDDGLKAALTYLKEGFTGDELSLEIKKANWEAQKKLIEKLESSLDTHLSARDKLRDALVNTVEGKKVAQAEADSTAKDVAEAVFTGGLSLLFGSGGDKKADLLEAQRKAIEMSLGYVEETVKQAQEKLKSAVETLQKLVDELVQSLLRQSTKRTAVDQLRIHVKQNILYYMQAIWAHEPPDQRFFRLYDLDIRWVSVPAGAARVEGMMMQAGRPLYLIMLDDGVGAWLPAPAIPSSQRKLVEVADLDHLLGFKGNYLMFPLKEPCYLTTYMMQEFVDDYLGVHDPDSFGTYTTEELLEYIECAYHHETTTEEDRALMRDLLIDRLTSPRGDAEEVVVPTGKLFIEALPGKHPLLEDFKLAHRAMDVKKVRAEVRGAELENLRRAARLIAGEREDPDIDKRVLVQGAGVVVEPG